VCPPNEKFCIDDASVGICNQSGTVFDEAPCPGQHFCSVGTCQPWVCTPNTTFCDGNIAKTCNSAGSGAAAQVDCASTGQFCLAGACSDCKPLCDGKLCNDDDGCGGKCGINSCPQLPGYTVACNTRDHCEYTNQDPTDWRKWDVWIWIPPGTFMMGSPDWELGHDPIESPVHAVTFTQGYFITKYEIVVAHYEACMADELVKCTRTNYLQSWAEADGWGINTSSGGRADHPQNAISWNEARKFCEWVAPGGHLPSEAEWEYAATGPEHHIFPWGDTPVPNCFNGTSVMDDEPGEKPCGCNPCMTPGCSGTSPVGSKPSGQSWCGALDMAGNVEEFVSDTCHDSYKGAPADGTAWEEGPSNCRMRRGGSFLVDAPKLRTAVRRVASGGDNEAKGGGRCARSLPP